MIIITRIDIPSPVEIVSVKCQLKALEFIPRFLGFVLGTLSFSSTTSLSFFLFLGISREPFSLDFRPSSVVVSLVGFHVFLVFFISFFL